MAEETQDKSQKTEEPTHKRLEDSRQKGQVATSREVNHWFMILAATISVFALAPSTMSGIRETLELFIAAPHAIPVGAETLPGLVAGVAGKLGLVLAPMMLVLVAAALGAGLIQNGLIIATEQLKPKLEKISIKSGLKRMFSMKSLAEFTKGILKLSVVGATGFLLMAPELDRIEETVAFPFLDSIGLLHSLAIRLLIGVLAVISVIALADFIFQRMQHMKQMRMSRQEIKDELKQTEGDPLVRSRLRQIRRERAQARMMQSVPDASVVITNPTHYAIALKYELNDMDAPLCLAKGVDHLALRIRTIAEENDVPVVENRPLAHALYETVEIGEEIPVEHYKAVAEIISYVLRMQGKLPGQKAQPARMSR